MTTRFSKHLGNGKELVIDGETYIIKPLTTDEAPLFLKVMKLAGDKGFDISRLTDESANAIRDILNVTLQKSFPEDWKADSAEVKAFGMKYMMTILPIIFEVNVPEGEEKEGREGKIEELKARVKAQHT